MRFSFLTSSSSSRAIISVGRSRALEEKLFHSSLSKTSAKLLRTRSFSSSSTSTSIDSETTGGSTSVPLSVTLYQYAICPFCNRAKVFLSYASQSYDIVEVNPLTKAELKPWSGDYKKVPIAKINSAQINGSKEIIHALANEPSIRSAIDTRHTNSQMTTMDDFIHGTSAKQWTEFADDDLAGLLYPNICRTLVDSYAAFGYVKDVPTFSTLQKLSIQGIGSVAMYIAASKIKSKRGITDEREALHTALSRFETEGLLGTNNAFSSGLDTPNMGDLAVFGVLKSVEGLPAHDDAIENRGGAIRDWYHRMQTEVERN
mmetsp:Transcript_14576/g.21510  ORF Transcript_14576/g.21510 Transcript_14576/m.21510 type:complete len:316 (+) Transcript_14576:128-1075(+)